MNSHPILTPVVCLVALTLSAAAQAQQQPPAVAAADPAVAARVPWIDQFHQAPATYRPMMFLVWNGQITPQRTTAMLEQFAARGMGGVFVHPRPGLITEYLSKEWFDAWKHVLAECKRLGMECHIYDENSYPSGFAGGQVYGSDPGTGASAMILVKLTSPTVPEGEVLGFLTLDPAGSTPKATRVSREAVKKASAQNPVYAVMVRPEPGRSMTANYPWVDLLNPQTTRKFLAVTHEQYARHLKDAFGKEIKYAFADEPYLQVRGRLPYSKLVLAEFRQEHGYDLAEKLDALCFDVPGAQGVRYDLFLTLQRLWTDNFLKPYYEWCKANNLAFTGHFWEHEWPGPAQNPSNMHSYRWMQAPGNDLLAFQFKTTVLADNRQALLNLKELSSVANQLGRERVLCETCGGGGYDWTIRDFKPLEDFSMAMGVNLINPHLSHQTIAGTRKYDWPQTMSDHSVWWSAYKLQADHVGRTLTALSKGKERNRVLVLHPDTSAWIHATLGDSAESKRRFETLRNSQQAIVLALYGRQVDFDLGDEFTMAELGEVIKDKLRVGQVVYDAVVVPPGMENCTQATLKRLGDLAAAGGAVFSGPTVPAYVNGRPSSAMSEVATKNAPQWRRLADVEALADAVRTAVPPRISAKDGSAMANLVWRRHELPGGAVLYFFCNPWSKSAFAGEIRVEGRSILALDTRTGQGRAVTAAPASAGQTALLEMPPLGHAIWLCLPEDHGLKAPPAAAQPTEPVVLSAGRIERASPNVLLIDYCDLDAGTARAQGIATVHADQMNWQAQGFAGNLWAQSSQHRRAFIDAIPRTHSGFAVEYHFTIGQAALTDALRSSLQIAIERPRLYRATLNGKPLDFASDGQGWFDEEMRRVAIGRHAQAGKNTLRLEAKPFHPLCEIMPVYVLGDFALQASERGFVIQLPEALKLGRWDQQGMPFFSDRVRYEYAFTLDRPAETMRVRLEQWAGSIADVRIDGNPAGTIALPPDQLEMKASLAAGKHTLVIEVCGNLKNLLGPHFNDGLPGIWTWRNCPQTTPPGEKYRFYPVGLLAGPQCQVGR